MAKVIFEGKSYEAAAGRDVLGTLLDGGAPIQFICMTGSCGMCRLRVISGGEHLLPVSNVEKRHYPKGDGSMRLGCQAVLLGTGDVEVTQRGV